MLSKALLSVSSASFGAAVAIGISGIGGGFDDYMLILLILAIGCGIVLGQEWQAVRQEARTARQVAHRINWDGSKR